MARATIGHPWEEWSVWQALEAPCIAHDRPCAPADRASLHDAGQFWHHSPPDRADCQAGGEPCWDRQAVDAARVATHLLGALLTTWKHHPDPAISPRA